MRRFLGFSLAVIALGAISGCGGSGGGGGGGSASSTIATIAASTASVEAFNGHYAFLLSGFDASGVPMAIAGSITADGNGHVTSGSVDVNDNQVVNSSATVAGTYTVDVNHRGIISFTTAVPGVTSLLAFAFTMRTDGTQATIIGFDNNNFVISGTMQQQTSSAFSLQAIAGNFVYETDSHAPQPMQRSNIGSFTISNTGAASGIYDASIAGSGPVSATSTAFTAQYNAPTTTTGRGTGTVNTTQSFVYYIISASKFVAIETDTAATSPTLGTTVATKQTIPSTPNTIGAVFALSGLDTSLGNTISAVGQIVVTGSSANFTWDSNDDATIFPGQVSGGPATVAYDPTTGRGTITALNQASSGLFNSAVFYLSSPGTGFILDTSAASANRALAGTLTQQTTVGTFAAASLSANTIGLTTTGDSPTGDEAVDLLFAVNTTNNTISGLQDITVVGSETPGQSFSGIVFGSVSPATGRGTLTVAGSSTSYAVYLVGPNQFVFVNITTSPVGISPLFIFSPQ